MLGHASVVFRVCAEREVLNMVCDHVLVESGSAKSVVTMRKSSAQLLDHQVAMSEALGQH